MYSLPEDGVPHHRPMLRCTAEGEKNAKITLEDEFKHTISNNVSASITQRILHGHLGVLKKIFFREHKELVTAMIRIK